MKEVPASSLPAAAEARLRTAPLATRLPRYLAERFPVLAHGILILSFYSSNQFLAHALVEPGRPMRYDFGSVLGYVTVLMFFLHLRIFDDHKDYHSDCQHFSQRVLQRGVVTLGELKCLGAFAIVLELTLSGVAGRAAFFSLLTAMAFSVLMLKEFFARAWLERHFVVYVLTHMLIMPLLALVIFSFATGRNWWQAPIWYWIYSFVGFFVALSWEVSRKIRAPEDEVDGIDTYTKLYGTYGAAYLVLLIRVVDTALVAIVAYHLRMSVWFYAWLIILFLICTIGFIQYRFWTSTATARRMATYAGFYIVAFDLALAIELVRSHGIVIGNSGT